MKMSDFPFAGHTEYFSAKDDHQTSLMFLVSDAIKVALVTNHLPISEVARNISKDLIIKDKIIEPITDCRFWIGKACYQCNTWFESSCV